MFFWDKIKLKKKQDEVSKYFCNYERVISATVLKSGVMHTYAIIADKVANCLLLYMPHKALGDVTVLVLNM